MPFFARPDLSNEQFKQLSGSTLTLSGSTQISSIGSLEFQDKSTCCYIPVVICNACEQDVLKYVSGCLVLGTVSTGGTSTGIYDGLSPSSVCVGGMPAGTYLTGRTITSILQEILVPTLPPVVTAQYYQSMSISPSTALYEIGNVITGITINSVFNLGSIVPYYGNNPPTTCLPSVPRSGPATAYNYVIKGLACPSTISNPYSLSPFLITDGNNTISGTVSYSAGSYSVYNSAGVQISAATTAGTTASKSISIQGIYPYYYGKLLSGSRPPVTNSLVTGGTKVVGSSISTVTVSFNSVGEYTWIAIPATSPSRVCWYVNALNSGCINCCCSDKYPDECIISISSGQNCWSSINYKVYMSKSAWTDPDPIQFRCS